MSAKFASIGSLIVAVALVSLGLHGYSPAAAPPAKAAAADDDPFAPGKPAKKAPAKKVPAADDPFGPSKPEQQAKAVKPKPVEVKKVESPKPRSSKKPAAGEEAVLKALDQRISLDFTETPLVDVIASIEDSAGILIQFDRKALDDVGVGTDTAITRSLPGVTLRSALDLLLRDLNLTWTIRSEVLLITTPEEADNMLVTKVYEVGDLVRVHYEQGATDDDFDSLIDLITSTLVPTTWDSVGGPGSIAPSTFGAARVLVISQTYRNHEVVAKLLADLRAAMKACGDQQPPVQARPPAGAAPGATGKGKGPMAMGGRGGASPAKTPPYGEQSKPPGKKPADDKEDKEK